MRARVVAGVLAWGIGLSSASANAQAPAAAFPPEATIKAEAPAAAPATEASPVTAAPTATPSVPAPLSPPVELAPSRAAPLEAAQPKPVPSWNVGAGIFSSGGLSSLSNELGVATYNAALERRLGSRAWLALNARFSYMTREAPVYPTTDDSNPPGTYRVDRSTAGALLALRYVFAHGLVDVSGSGAAYADYQHVEGDQATGLRELGSGSRRELGLLLGMAVERELIEALALRLSLNLASASVAFQDSPRIDDTGVVQPRILVTGRLGFAIEPGLHLHFYF